MKDLETLKQLETLAKAATAQPLRTKALAEGLYADRVALIAKRDGLDDRAAHAAAANDRIACELYAIIERASHDAATVDSAFRD